MALSVSRLVRVTVNLSPAAAANRSFGVLMIAGDSNVISGLERFRTYLDIDGVVSDFGVNSPEYKAAALYFGQTPKPQTLMIGRYIRTATAGQNEGGILSPSQQVVANFSSITNGGLIVTVDGVTKTLTGLNFTGVTNLNGVASVINAALSGASVAWNGTSFVVTSNTSGAGANASGSVSFSGVPSVGAQASGTITLSGQPANLDTITIKGTVVTFVTAAPTGNQVQIGALVADTSNNLQAFLAASVDTNLAASTYSTSTLITTITAKVFGTAGNAYALAKSGANIAVSGATLSGGVAPDSLTLNGSAVTFVSGAPTGNQVQVGASANATATNLQAFAAASADVNIAQATYSVVGNIVSVLAALPGIAGNGFTLAKSGANLAVSGASLAGGVAPSSVGFATPGSGTDLSSLLKLTAPLALALIPGYNAETPVACAAALANKSSAWYGLMFQASVQPTNQQSLDVSTFIEAQTLTRIYGVTITDTSVLSSLVSNDLASLMMAGSYEQSFCQYSQNPYAVASMFGRAFSVNFNANSATITLMFKQEPAVTAEQLDENQANTLQAKRCNVFTGYVNGTLILQYGVMSGPAYFDEIHGLDWFQDAIQTACYNILYQTTTKVPQTDAGVNQLVNAIAGVCESAVNNGLVAPGTWNANGFGTLQPGQFLKTGYYIYAQPIALQSQSDRETRNAPPIQVAIKLAGAIQGMDAIINVNR